MNEVAKYENDTHILKIIQDEDAGNPREEFDNLGTMIGFSGRYNIGDKHHYGDYREFLEDLAKVSGMDYYRSQEVSDKALVAFIERRAFIIPYDLYGSDSGPSVSSWDYDGDGFLTHDGYIYVSKQAVRDEWKVKRISPEVRESVLSNLRAEVNQYAQWREGEVYGFILHEKVRTDCQVCGGRGPGCAAGTYRRLHHAAGPHEGPGGVRVQT